MNLCVRPTSFICPFYLKGCPKPLGLRADPKGKTDPKSALTTHSSHFAETNLLPL